MIKLFVGFFILTGCLLSHSATTVPGFVPSVSLAGVEIPMGQAILLQAFTSGNNRYAVMLRNNTAYIVPAGFKFVGYAIKSTTLVNTGVATMIKYGDNSLSDTATVPTNVVDVTGVAAVTGLVVGDSVEVPVYFEIPAGKYPYVFHQNGYGSSQILGYLVRI